MVDAYDDAFALNGAWASLAADARADRPRGGAMPSSPESSDDAALPKDLDALAEDDIHRPARAVHGCRVRARSHALGLAGHSGR